MYGLHKFVSDDITPTLAAKLVIRRTRQCAYFRARRVQFLDRPYSPVGSCRVPFCIVPATVGLVALPLGRRC